MSAFLPHPAFFPRADLSPALSLSLFLSVDFPPTRQLAQPHPTFSLAHSLSLTLTRLTLSPLHSLAFKHSLLFLLSSHSPPLVASAFVSDTSSFIPRSLSFPADPIIFIFFLPTLSLSLSTSHSSQSLWAALTPQITLSPAILHPPHSHCSRFSFTHSLAHSDYVVTEAVNFENTVYVCHGIVAPLAFSWYFLQQYPPILKHKNRKLDKSVSLLFTVHQCQHLVNTGTDTAMLWLLILSPLILPEHL